MIKKTLLEMVQNILSAMDSDEVNSIGDTIEALQVAEVVRDTYEAMVVAEDLAGLEGLVKLDASQDLSRPNVLKAPRELEKADWIRYNDKEVVYLTPGAFVRRSLGHNLDNPNVLLVDGIKILNNQDPRYYTSFDDTELFFESYNAAEDNTLQQSKTMVWGKKFYNFEMSDEFIPELPPAMFPRLLSEAKATCFVLFKQVANSKAEAMSRNLKVKSQNDRYRNGSKEAIDRLPNYGRRSARFVSRRPSERT